MEEDVDIMRLCEKRIERIIRGLRSLIYDDQNDWVLQRASEDLHTLTCENLPYAERLKERGHFKSYIRELQENIMYYEKDLRGLIKRGIVKDDED